MKLDEILGKKGREVVTIDDSRTVLEAARLLVERNIGSLVVVMDGRLRGIITERDVLRLTAGSPGDLDSLRVRDAMTRDVVTAKPNDDLRSTMDVMTERRIRHLPVVQDERLVGIVSIGDLVNACRISAEAENSHLRQYIQTAG
ncbi:MAG: CBS domain-containing protein [Longimicrobiales bacterium]|nr:CBS domain-containing protein [Longimicrobiales bacterium]